MKTTNIIEGLKILHPYYDDPEGSHNGAEHDEFYAYATDKKVSKKDLIKLVELGWHQDVDTGDYEFNPSHYDVEESWIAYV